MNPLFSILICTVGKPELTRMAIQSILVQSEQDFEIIVTDTSASTAIADVVASFDDPRVRFFTAPDHDPALSWDFAYDQSRGQYVLWYDDDNCLVPWALEYYRNSIALEAPDIISANHAYYYAAGNRHLPGVANALTALLPYTLERKVYDAEDVIDAFLTMRDKKRMPKLWHSAATFVSREICEKVKKRTGNVITPKLYGNFHFHPLLFAYAQKPMYDDRPLSIIGKFESSMTQQWSGVVIKEKRQGMSYKLTGLSARTLANTIAECYLTAQKLIPEKLGQYQLNWEQTFRMYIAELISVRIPIQQQISYWRELWNRVSEVLPAKKRELHMMMLKSVAKAFFLRIARFLHIWEPLRKRFQSVIVPPNPDRVIVDLQKYNISSILECARQLDTVMQKEFGIDIR